MTNGILNVLLVLPKLEQGGVERCTVDIATSLKEEGHNPVVISAGGIMVKELKRHGIEHIQLPVHAKDFFSIRKNAKILENIIKEKEIDVVHAGSRAPAWSCKKACDETGAAFITTFHGIYGLGPFGMKKRYNKVMTMGDIVIAPSNFVYNHIKENYPINEDKIHVVHRWVDTDKFNTNNVSAERIINLANKLRIPDDQKIITMLGRLTRIKGQSVFIEAVSKIKDDNFCAIMVGNPKNQSYKRELQGLIEHYNLENKVFIVDGCNDIPALYLLTDVAVSASVQPESFGLTTLEAQAIGKPVVATGHGGSLEIIMEGKTGTLVEPNNSDSLAKGLEWALELNEEEREQIAKTSIKNVRFNFAKNIMCLRVIDLYKKAIEGKRKH